VPLAVTIEQMRSELQRELGMRRAVYPRWVRQGKKRPEEAATQIERLEAMLEALEELQCARGITDILMRAYANAVNHGTGAVTLSFQDARDGRLLAAAIESLQLPRAAPLTMGQRPK